MAQRITSSFTLALNVTEVGDAADFPASLGVRSRTIVHNGNDVTGRLLTGETVSPQAVVSELVDASKTLDLTVAPKSGGATQDLSGKQLLQLILTAPLTNAAAVTFGPHATDGYTFLGLASGVSLSIPPGSSFAFSFVAESEPTTPEVDADEKQIAIVVTGDDVLQYTATFGVIVTE